VSLASPEVIGLADPVDLVGADREDDADLVPAAAPGIRSAQVALREGLDVFPAAFGGDIYDPSTDRVVAGRVRRVGDYHGHAWVARDVSHLLKALDRVDDDVLAVGVDPCLGDLG